MEASRLDYEQPKGAPSQSGNRLLVRMGGKEWTIGDPEPALPTETANDKMIAPNDINDRDTGNTPANDQGSMDLSRVLSTLRTWWARIHEFASQSLDKLVLQNEVAAGKATFRPAKRFMSKTLKNRSREGFTFGTIVGLMLGCIGLVVFHLVAPEHIAPVGALSDAVVSSPAQGTPKGDNGYLIPAVRVYATQVGSYHTVQQAKDAQNQFLHRGIQTTLLLEPPIRLVTKAALQSDHLKTEQQHLEGLKIPVVITTLQWNVQTVPVTQSTSLQNAQAVSHWLSAEVSALNTITGLVSDGEPARDADVAFQTAGQVVPPLPDINATGQGGILSAIHQATNHAYQYAKNGNSDVAMENVLQSYALIQELVDHAESNGN